MARKKSQSNTATGGGAKSKTAETNWLNYKLTPDDVGIVVGDTEDLQQLVGRLAGLFAHGADFSVRYVPDRQNWSAFCISPAVEGGAGRTGISAFGGSQWQALSALLYKVDLHRNNPDAFTASGKGLGIG